MLFGLSFIKKHPFFGLSFIFLYLCTAIHEENEKMSIDKVSYWIEIADYDLETAEAMFSTQRWLYVAFMCHQSIEKTLKAYWCSTMTEDPPYTHNHMRLADGCGLYDKMSEEQKDFLDTITNYNIEARYPEDKEALFRTLTKPACRQLIDDTKLLILWIRNELSAATRPLTSSDATSES